MELPYHLVSLRKKWHHKKSLETKNSKVYSAHLFWETLFLQLSTFSPLLSLAVCHGFFFITNKFLLWLNSVKFWVFKLLLLSKWQFTKVHRQANKEPKNVFRRLAILVVTWVSHKNTNKCVFECSGTFVVRRCRWFFSSKG